MSYKTILVHAQDDEAAQGRMRLAMDVARLFEAVVFGVAAESWLPVTALPEFGYVPGEVMADLERDALARLDRAKAKFLGLAREVGCGAICEAVTDLPRDAIVRFAHCGDLIVASRPKDLAADGLVASPADLVMPAGLPVLIAADSLTSISGDHVVIGWKDTRESRRAISEALPFLKRASAVTVAQVTTPGCDLDEVRKELDEVTGRLLRHGVHATPEAVPAAGHVCEALESVAARKGSDLIVLGAYGHSRLRESVFGGVTQGFLHRGSAHVLLSH
jgi:nucleotide-binding universal stress UspA family protein